MFLYFPNLKLDYGNWKKTIWACIALQNDKGLWSSVTVLGLYGYICEKGNFQIIPISSQDHSIYKNSQENEKQ